MEKFVGTWQQTGTENLEAFLKATRTSNCSCPEDMLDYKDKCISFKENKLTNDEARKTCLKHGGDLAGIDFDIVSELNTNPHFRTLIPLPDKPTEYWAIVVPDVWQAALYLAVDKLTNASGNVDVCHHTLDYDTVKWSQSVCRGDAKRQFLCQFDKPKEQLRRKKLSMIRKKSTGTYLVESPAFETKVFSITFCTRTCEKASGCDSVNYNPSTGACIGYIHETRHEYQNTPGWEIWSFVL